MKKIPTLFKRIYDEKTHGKKDTINEVTPGMEWVLDGQGIATLKVDGSCCAIIDGKFYKRYDAKAGKVAPADAIPCCDPDPITGHWPHWVLVERNDPGDKWHIEGYKNTPQPLEDGTYEIIGPHFRNNPYHLDSDILVKHGITKLEDCPRDYEGIKEYLKNHNIEGIVFWKDNEPQCKIKRSDFGLKWPMDDNKYF